MDWSYVAGLFDGEGSISLNRKLGSLGSNSITLTIAISASYELTRNSLQSFLRQNDINVSLYDHKNPLGRSAGIRIASWRGCEQFCDTVLPFSIEKRRHLEVAKKIITLHKEAKNEGKGAVMAHIEEFDRLRHELHALASKGPKLTKKW